MAITQIGCRRYQVAVPIVLAIAIGFATRSTQSQEPVRAPKLPPLPSEGPSITETLLLKDFRPRSIFKAPRTAIGKPRYPIIDVHSHPFVVAREELDQWVRTMDDCGVERAVIMVASAGRKFDALVPLFKNFQPRFTLWCGIDLTNVDAPGYPARAVAELERCHALGATGVGELVDKGAGLFSFDETPESSGVRIDDERLDPLLERCAALKMPVSVHVAEPMWMYEPMDETNEMLVNASNWRLYGRTDVIGHAELIATLDRAVGKHPRTTFVACHYANCTHDLTILGDLLDKHDNLYADISARYAQVASIPRQAKRFFEQYQDRLLFGSDFNLSAERFQDCFRILESEDEHFYEASRTKVQWPLYGLGLGDTVLRKLYRDNAQRILGG